MDRHQSRSTLYRYRQLHEPPPRSEYRRKSTGGGGGGRRRRRRRRASSIPTCRTWSHAGTRAVTAPTSVSTKRSARSAFKATPTEYRHGEQSELTLTSATPKKQGKKLRAPRAKRRAKRRAASRERLRARRERGRAVHGPRGKTEKIRSRKSTWVGCAPQTQPWPTHDG
jgi:hypothetical protein